MLFPPQCILCEKIEVKTRGSTERTREFPHWNHKESGWCKISAMAEEMGNNRLWRRTAGVDLHARSANYHRSCYNTFTRDYENFKHGQHRGKEETDRARLTAAHQNAYEAVVHYIEENIIGHNKVVQLAFLHAVYVDALEKSGSPNPDYRGEKLLIRIRNDPQFNNRITGSKVTSGNQGSIFLWLLYRADITTSDAMAWAYKLGSAENIKGIGLHLRSIIKRAFKESAELPSAHCARHPVNR